MLNDPDHANLKSARRAYVKSRGLDYTDTGDTERIIRIKDGGSSFLEELEDYPED